MSGFGKPMQQRKHRMKFERMPSIGCGNECISFRNPDTFPNELKLALESADVFDNSRRKHQIEAAIVKWQSTPVAMDESKARKGLFHPGGILIRERGYPILMRK
jgi:hypothetical protein